MKKEYEQKMSKLSNNLVPLVLGTNSTNSTISTNEHRYIKENRTFYPILWRKKGSTLTDRCKFCNTQHKHGEGEGIYSSYFTREGEGIREPLCKDTIDKDGTVSFIMSGYFATDGRYFAPRNGYILREY